MKTSFPTSNPLPNLIHLLDEGIMEGIGKLGMLPGEDLTMLLKCRVYKRVIDWSTGSLDPL